MISRDKGAATALGLGRRHSRRVDRLRFILPVTALIMLIMILAWPWLNGGYHGFIMPVFNRVAGLDADRMRMHNPRYVGRTKEHEPYEVSATSAFLDPKNQHRIHLDELTAVVERNAAEDVHMRANEGLYYRDRGVLDLKGDLELRVGERYIFNTSEASVKFDVGEVVGPMPVTGEGPIGTLAADRFNVTGHGKHLRFDGHVQVVYQPTAPSL
ncbi:MAG: LPS export ABC transporter periplasmic protein LptC [Geminicoccaceae bacterium]